MLFNAPEYIFAFLPITVVIYYFLNRINPANVAKTWLVLASLFFYGYWNTDYLLLITTSMLVNFAIGSAIHKTKANSTRSHNFFAAKPLLASGIVFNLGLLAYFKYFDFFIANINSLFDSNLPLLHLILPLAISFFTFQQIAYLVDNYKTDTKEYSLLNYCLFVTFFPQLIAGPIVHHKEMMPQFASLQNKFINWNNVIKGIFIFSIGLFKKVIIADTFASWANAGYYSTSSLDLLQAWFTSLSYTFQLYYDFSGYTDMAIGAALLFNIKLPVNFNSPYKAVNIQDFWRRWHMTLSRWLRDYLYIPLGGNRSGELLTYRNLFITFLLGGLWHGAGWTFVIWGALHGCALMIHRLWHKMGFHMPVILAWPTTFLFVNFTWVFFRANSLPDAIHLIRAMFGLNGVTLSLDHIVLVKAPPPVLELISMGYSDTHSSLIVLCFMVLFATIAGMGRNSIHYLSDNILIKKHHLAFSAVVIFSSYLMSITDVPTEFLYFNF